MNTERIWKTAVMIKDGKLYFVDPHYVDMPTDFISRYSWDRLIRIDIPEKMETWFMAKDKITLESFWNGWYAYKEFAVQNVIEIEDAYKLLNKQFLERVEEIC